MRTWTVGTLILICVASLPAIAENVDPGEDGSQYAWAENVGWLNAQPGGESGAGMQVGDAELSGWVWAENAGWISLSCKNTLSCATTEYGILNDGSGVLSGYAWAENVGWINFSPSTSGVSIDPATGEFSGYAWGENVGWISFNCSNTASCATVDYMVTTGWICSPLPAAPSGTPSLDMNKAEPDALLSWNPITGETGYDIAHGDLACLRSSGSFVGCTLGCLDDNRTTTSLLHTATPSVGNGYWVLVRGQNCGGNGTFGATNRDSEISDCP